MAKKINEELDLSRTDDAGVPYSDPNAPSVVQNREVAYQANEEQKDYAAERQRIADGIAQEKAQREAANKTAQPAVTPVKTAVAPNQSSVQPPVQSEVQTAMEQVKGAVGGDDKLKSKTAGIGKSSASGVTGYDIVSLESGSDSEGRQDTTSSSLASGETSQTQKTVFDPNEAQKNVQAIDPFLAKVDRDGAAKAFLDVYGEKPSPDALNNAAELARKKNKIATISESIRVLFDMASAGAGGNVYNRDQIQQNIQENKAELAKEEAKYQAALDKFNEGLLGAKGTDLATKRSLMNDAIKAGYSTKSDGTSKQFNVGASNTSTQQTTKGINEQAVTDLEWAKQRDLAMAGAAKDEKKVQVIGTVVNPQTGQTNEQVIGDYTESEWDAVKSRVSYILADDKATIKAAAQKYKVSEDAIRKSLIGEYGEDELIGTKTGKMSYKGLADEVVKNYGMQNPRSSRVMTFKQRRNQSFNPDDTRQGTVDANQMAFATEGDDPNLKLTNFANNLK